MDFKPVIFYSSALNSRKICYIYLPPSYHDSDKEFPVIYLLHGMNGGETDWIYKGNVHETIEKMYSQNELRESIIVLPSDGGYDRGTFYMDWYDGSGNFEQYFIYDLVPYIDNNFRTAKTPELRGIGGFSMGGYGAFMLALRNPHLFGSAASVSGALGPMSAFSDFERARLVGPIQGPHAQKYDLSRLSALREAESPPALFINCGTEDYLYQANVWFKNHLQSIQYECVYQEFSGEHNWDYCKAHMAGIFRFFEALFKR